MAEEYLRQSIEPKSDQLNYDDVAGRTIIIKITAVERGSSSDQPVSIRYEGDNGRAYKPCKSMRRIMIWAWGEDGRDWVGRRLALFGDPEVKFGGVKVGGVRIKRMSGIDQEMNFSLTAARGKRSPYIVKPLPDEKAGADDKDEPPAKRKARELWAAIGKCETVEQLDALQTTQTNGKHLDAIEQADPAAHGHIIKRFADRRKELEGVE